MYFFPTHIQIMPGFNNVLRAAVVALSFLALGRDAGATNTSAYDYDARVGKGHDIAPIRPKVFLISMVSILLTFPIPLSPPHSQENHLERPPLLGLFLVI